MKRRFPGGQTDEFHPQGVEHVFHDDLLIWSEIALRLFFQHGEEIDDFFGLRQVQRHGRLLRIELLPHQHQS